MRTLEQKQQQFAEVKELLEHRLIFKTKYPEDSYGYLTYLNYFQQALEIYLRYNRSTWGSRCSFNCEEYLVKEFKLGAKNKKVIAVHLPCKNLVMAYVYSEYDKNYTLVEANYFLETENTNPVPETSVW